MLFLLNVALMHKILFAWFFFCDHYALGPGSQDIVGRYKQAFISWKDLQELDNKGYYLALINHCNISTIRNGKTENNKLQHWQMLYISHIKKKSLLSSSINVAYGFLTQQKKKIYQLSSTGDWSNVASRLPREMNVRPTKFVGS
ncbi:hypothetical protein BDA99DRAFT_542300 [Phascolomyces articulosus]|uniref:Homing endonuclease LAGLIDADG domain-containing protein n=1 Tax=Phascolomyces articulosus TaxID=60185 RepID=A0AAD5JPZ2_9FUNG|nr:hypothetical protein BDA99DRAFT_542300 [Phascolomyces articulosus]